MPKTVLITGCGPQSIGSALAKAFHGRGHTVFATSRTATHIDPALAALPGLHTLALDVTSDDSIAAALAAVSAATTTSDGPRPPTLDILVNAAGVMHILPFADTPASEARRVFDVNVLGHWAVAHAFLPLLLEAAARGRERSRGGGGRGNSVVASLASVNEIFCPPFLAAYNASKAALSAFDRTLRRELHPFGVRVVTVKTGSVRTQLFDSAKLPKLPDASLYAPLRSWIEGQGFLGFARWQSRDAYAEAVVGDLLKAADGRGAPVVWRGGLATVAWLLSWLGWESMLDGSAIKQNGLDKLQYKGSHRE